MADVEILEPVLNGGIKNASFTDGQLLTAENLRTEQMAARAQHRQLGRAIGAGVVCGYVVGIVSPAATKPVLSVAKGLAFNSKGDALELAEDSTVTLLKNADANAADTAAGLFAPCTPSKGAVTNAGLYILTVQPASGFDGQIEMTELVESDAIISTCGRKFAIEGVQFRLVQVDLGAGSVRAEMATLHLAFGTAGPALEILRSGAAHILFGTDILGLRFGTDPFNLTGDDSSFLSYGLLDEMREAKLLTACEVPLALVYWTAMGVQFVDTRLVSVRRRLTPPLVGNPWPLVIDPRRVYESQAMLLQFQAQLEDIRDRLNTQTVTAKTHFRFLPAAGFVPVTGSFSFHSVNFWKGLDVDNVNLDPAFARSVVHQSYFVEPIDLASPPPLRLYQVSDKPGYLLFFRDEILPKAPPPSDVSEPSKDPGNILIEITSKNADLLKRLLAVDPKEIRVWAEDTRKKRYDAKPYIPGSQRELKITGRQSKTSRYYVISKIPAGTYTVRVESSWTSPAAQIATVKPANTVTVTFNMVVKGSAGPKTGRGDTLLNVGLENAWYDKAKNVRPVPRGPWPPPEEGPDWQTIAPRPEEDQKLLAYANRIATEFPDAAVDPGDIQIYVDKNHTPDETSHTPYAYMAFGNGAYVPIVLVPKGKEMGASMPVTRGEVGGLDEPTNGENLREAGIHDMETFANAWTNLVADALDVSGSTAQSMVAEARQKSAVLQNSTGMFAGVDRALMAELIEAGVKTADELANIAPDVLLKELGESSMSEAFAKRLVEDARKAVPAASWSLDAPELGLSESDKTALRKNGIQTRGDLEGASAAALARALGTPEKEATALLKFSKALRKEAAATKQASAPITEVAGVNKEAALELADLGILSVGELAGLDAGKIAHVFGGSAEAAGHAIAGAQTLLKR